MLTIVFFTTLLFGWKSGLMGPNEMKVILALADKLLDIRGMIGIVEIDIGCELSLFSW